MNPLKEYRTKNNLTQLQLAIKLGCSQSLVTHIESGRRRVSWENAISWEKRTNKELTKEILAPHIFS